MANQFMFNLQNANCFLMEELTFFHDHAMFFLVMILSVVFYINICLVKSNFLNLNLLFNEEIETIWTILPGIILVGIALPSLKVLYLMDDSLDNPMMTLKTIGHQWNWSYEYPDFGDIEINSFMKTNISPGEFRLLEVDNRVVLPVNMNIRVITTSSDVIHSWTVPSLGVKMDTNPGRLNQFLLQSTRLGIFYGQCSEICGTLHSFMPICVEMVNLDTFKTWIKTLM